MLIHEYRACVVCRSFVSVGFPFTNLSFFQKMKCFGSQNSSLVLGTANYGVCAQTCPYFIHRFVFRFLAYPVFQLTCQLQKVILLLMSLSIFQILDPTLFEDFEALELLA